MIDNKAIFHYLNPDGCWHEINEGKNPCIKCGNDLEFGIGCYNPDYTTEHGFFLLLDGLKNVNDGDLRVEVRQTSNIYIVRLKEFGRKLGLGIDADIRIALAEAVMELIPKDGEL